MNFLIAATFTDALARLPGPEQKAAKTSAFDLQTNPPHPGLQMHRIGNSRDPNLWSARVSADLRIMVHKTPASLLARSSPRARVLLATFSEKLAAALAAKARLYIRPQE